MKNFKKKISNSFDKGSKFYELNSNIQKKICIELISFYKKQSIMNEKIKFKNALEIGCGSGFMTNKINKIENLNNVHLIDISKKMISKAKENLKKKRTFPLRLQTLIPLKIIKFMILFFQICHCIGQKISQNFFFIY